jgi:hypothetical protein
LSSTPLFSKPEKVVAILSVVAFLATVWPIYPVFDRIEPMVLGMPFSLFYLVAIIFAVFAMMLGLYLWEDRTGRLDGDDP